MATNSLNKAGRTRRPPLDNTKLIADVITIIRENLAMLAACRQASVLGYTIMDFESRVEERWVRGKASDCVYGRISFCHTDGMSSDSNPLGVPAWVVDIITREDGPAYHEGRGKDEGRKLSSCTEIAEAFYAHVEDYGTQLRLYIPTGE